MRHKLIQITYKMFLIAGNVLYINMPEDNVQVTTYNSYKRSQTVQYMLCQAASYKLFDPILVKLRYPQETTIIYNVQTNYKNMSMLFRHIILVTNACTSCHLSSLQFYKNNVRSNTTLHIRKVVKPNCVILAITSLETRSVCKLIPYLLSQMCLPTPTPTPTLLPSR